MNRAGRGHPSPLDNEQCRQCSSFSDYIKQTKKKKDEESGVVKDQNGNSDAALNISEDKPRRTDCPLDRDELGNRAWGVLHTMAARYPEQPTSNQKCEIKSFFNIFAKFYPCDHCAKDFQEELKIDPPRVESQEALSQWLCRIHNKVNVKVGKEVFDCSKVNERWRDGWLDGSCDY